MNWKIIILLVITTILLQIIVSGDLINTMPWKTFFIGLTPSIIASIIIYIFLSNSQKIKKLSIHDVFSEIEDTPMLHNIIDKAIYKLNKKNFNRVDINRNMGEEYWTTHIQELDNSQESAWFVGSGMSLWLENEYKTPLKSKLVERFTFICQHKRKKHQKVYILLVKDEYIKKWNSLFAEVINEVLKNISGNSHDKCEEMIKDNYVIQKIQKTNLKYSIVKCSDNINISMRTNSGRSGDSPTMDIHSSSTVGQYFIDDLKLMKDLYNLDD